MTGEVQNILMGSIVTTVEYDTSRRLIGVSTTNLIPGPTGVAPLSKQGAFQVQEKNDTMETVDFVQALTSAQGTDDAIAETVDLPMLDQQPILKEPVHSDVITENPVQVENPSAMASFDLQSIEIPTQPEETKEEKPVAIDVQMPEMSDAVVADEPTDLNEQLFEGTPTQSTSILEEPTTIAPVAEESKSEIASLNEAAATSTPSETQNVVLEENHNNETLNIEMPKIPTAQEIVPPIDEAPKVDIQLPIIEEKQEDNIMEAIPSTTPDMSIPTFNIEMPVIEQSQETVPTEEVVIEAVSEEALSPEDNTNNIQAVENSPSSEQSREESTNDETQNMQTQPDMNNTSEDIKTEMPPVIQEKPVELPQAESEDKSEVLEQQSDVKEIKEIIHQHRLIIEDCATSIAKIADELKKAAKSLAELEQRAMETVNSKEETAAKVEEIVQQGNSLVNDAFDRINAIATPRL